MSKVIKSYEYHPLLPGDPRQEDGGIPVMTGAEPDEQAQNIIDEAFKKAKKIVDSAQSYSTQQLREAAEKSRQEIEESRRTGYREGYARGMEKGEKEGRAKGDGEGYREGLDRAKTKNRQNLEELSHMIEAVEKSKSAILDKFEDDLKDLALTIARAILKKEVETDGKAMRSIILNATDAYRNQSWLRIFVSGRTAEILLKADNDIVSELKNVSDAVKVVSVSGMSDGDCILEMPDRVIDAGIGTQLKKIRDAVNQAVHHTDVREG